jgi:hypothetical protein
VAGAVFTELSLFLILQDAEGFARKIMANFFMDDTPLKEIYKFMDVP